MTFFEIISFIAELVGILSDLNELLTSDSNGALDIILFRLLRNKKEKNPNLVNSFHLQDYSLTEPKKKINCFPTLRLKRIYLKMVFGDE
ncbi:MULTISPECIES: hypothetical protein [unclassified Peribacillus]|uniref:hypothetical protein n=1 Tax=unclassified Peribacillus TaxID=2675266 RepID=UPI0036DC61D6